MRDGDPDGAEQHQRVVRDPARPRATPNTPIITTPKADGDAKTARVDQPAAGSDRGTKAIMNDIDRMPMASSGDAVVGRSEFVMAP